MQPKIITKGSLLITGLSGDGAKTAEVWNDFDRSYSARPFPKAEECGYEIRFHGGEKPAPRGKDVHVGFANENADTLEGFPCEVGPPFATVILPATEYAVFDVQVAKGYDSGNEAMDKWLADNSAQYRQFMLDGVAYVVECYGEKFKSGRDSDSIVEIWIPVYRSCQSCGMSLVAEMVFGKGSTENVFGKEKDGSPNRDYCYLCYIDGAFSTNDTMEEMIERCVPYTCASNPWPDEDTARREMQKFFPKLKRWAK